MRMQLTSFARSVKSAFLLKGVDITGFIFQFPEREQRKRKGLEICFEAVTHNPHFFGREYVNQRRIKLIDLAYEIAHDELSKMFPDHHITLDVYVRLQEPSTYSSPMFTNIPPKEGFVDVTSDHDVRFVRLQDALKSGEVDPGSMFHVYCQRYGIEHILKHGMHHISPDSASVEAFEAICDIRNVESVLEIGAGVGVCGVAAEERGIEDFTFVDVSQKVCDYLRKRFQYPVIQASAFDFPFSRHWDVILMGIPYELNPWFLSDRGVDLRNHCDLVVFNSGMCCMFNFEHDWICGKKHFAQWPWWAKDQTLPFYFRSAPVVEAAFDWQLCAIAGKDSRELKRLTRSLAKRGFDTPMTHRIVI
ncbi:MAG: class I SAM-dependent methyltransferase [Candidatus Paceibacterota bacterium]